MCFFFASNHPTSYPSTTLMCQTKVGTDQPKTSYQHLTAQPSCVWPAELPRGYCIAPSIVTKYCTTSQFRPSGNTCDEKRGAVAVIPALRAPRHSSIPLPPGRTHPWKTIMYSVRPPCRRNHRAAPPQVPLLHFLVCSHQSYQTKLPDRNANGPVPQGGGAVLRAALVLRLTLSARYMSLSTTRCHSLTFLWYGSFMTQPNRCGTSKRECPCHQSIAAPGASSSSMWCAAVCLRTTRIVPRASFTNNYVASCPAHQLSGPNHQTKNQ